MTFTNNTERTYAIDCVSEGESILVQRIAFKKGVRWATGDQEIRAYGGRRLYIYRGTMTHGTIGTEYAHTGPVKVISLSDLNRMEKYELR